MRLSRAAPGLRAIPAKMPRFRLSTTFPIAHLRNPSMSSPPASIGVNLPAGRSPCPASHRVIRHRWSGQLPRTDMRVELGWQHRRGWLRLTCPACGGGLLVECLPAGAGLAMSLDRSMSAQLSDEFNAVRDTSERQPAPRQALLKAGHFTEALRCIGLITKFGCNVPALKVCVLISTKIVGVAKVQQHGLHLGQAGLPSDGEHRIWAQDQSAASWPPQTRRTAPHGGPHRCSC